MQSYTSQVYSAFHGNPLRTLANRKLRANISTASLVMNGSYHVDTLVRPVAQQTDVRPGVVNEILAQADHSVAQMTAPSDTSLKLPHIRTPKRSGWTSPSATGAGASA